MILQANGNQNKEGIAILISDQINCKPKKKGKMRQMWALYKDKGDNPSRRCNILLIYMHPHRNTKT